MKNAEKNILRMDRAFAQLDVTYKKRTLVRYIDGERVETKIKATSPDQERINDALTLSFQKQVGINYNYYELNKQALKILNDKFIEKGLNYQNLTFGQKRIRSAAIQQVIDSLIIDSFSGNPVMHIDFDELFNIASLKTTRSFKDKIKTVYSILGRGAREGRRDRVNLDTMEIEDTKFSLLVEVTGVNFVLVPEMGVFFKKFSDFVEAEIDPITRKKFRNKQKYIKFIEISFSKNTIPYIVAQSTDYIQLKVGVRKKYKLQNTYMIDTYITSIQNAQEYRNLTDFTPENLMKKFGHNYKRFFRYLNDVIDPSIEDFNNNGYRKLSYLLKKKSGEWVSRANIGKTQIEKFRWVIENYKKTQRDGIDPITYYVALVVFQQGYETLKQFNSIREVALSISEQLNSDIPSMMVLFGKSIAQWKEEAKYELECEKKILEILVVSDQEDVFYESDLMAINSFRYELKKINTPSQSLDYLLKDLRLSLPKSKKTKSIPFPSYNKKFVSSLINKAISNKYTCPLQFYFFMKNYYENKEIKRSNWDKTVNSWFANDKYDKTKKCNCKYELLDGSGKIHLGTWNSERFLFETDLVNIELKTNKLVELLVHGLLKEEGIII